MAIILINSPGRLSIDLRMFFLCVLRPWKPGCRRLFYVNKNNIYKVIEEKGIFSNGRQNMAIKKCSMVQKLHPIVLHSLHPTGAIYAKKPHTSLIERFL